jgi:hypothetical protein
MSDKQKTEKDDQRIVTVFFYFPWVCGTEPLNSRMPLKGPLFSTISGSVVRSPGHQDSTRVRITMRRACTVSCWAPLNVPVVQRIDQSRQLTRPHRRYQIDKRVT